MLTLDDATPSLPYRLLAKRNGEFVATLLRVQLSRADHTAVTDVSPKPRHNEKKSDSQEEDLVRAAQSGDRSAFGALYERYAPMVHGILLGRVPAGAVEDLVQDVFMKAMPRVGSLRDTAHFGAWLAAIARNRAVDFFREATPGQAHFEDAGEGEPESKSKGNADGADAEHVLAAIRRLPEAYRETLILRLVEGMTGPEIAARTGLTHGSVRVNLHRGMQQLRELLEGSAGSAHSAVKR